MSYVKDFFWLIVKDNFLVNCFYVKIFPYFFSKKHFNSENSTDKLTTKRELTFSSKPKGIYFKGYTSGTTNSPMTVYRSIPSIFLEEYVFKTYTYKNGVPLSSRIAVIRGDMIKEASDLKPPYWKKMPFTGRLIMSSFHLSPTTIPQYLSQLEEYRPHMIMAYPSSITQIAQEAIKLGWKPSWDFRGVFTSSETFSQENKKLVEAVFGHVFDHYGQAERVAVLQSCSFGNYHVREEYSKVEFVKDDNGLKIVGSNYYNSAMPIQRYDTGDYVKGYENSIRCECGNCSPYVAEIMGRDDDYVILKDGRKVGRLDVAFKGIQGLFACQIEQVTFDKLLVKFVSEKNIKSENLASNIEDNLRERLGHDISIECCSVETIARTKAGKFKSVIRRVN